MDYIKSIINFKERDIKEKEDKKVILDFIEKYGEKTLHRESKIAHFTSSGFIMNKDMTKTLMVHHNIMNTWVWTGGHVDGDKNFLNVAIKEAKEETGLEIVTPFSKDIISIDILPVDRHVKNGSYVNSHLHLSIAYILIADEKDNIFIKKDENSDIRWFPLEYINKANFSKNDLYLYKKIIDKGKKMKKS